MVNHVRTESDVKFATLNEYSVMSGDELDEEANRKKPDRITILSNLSNEGDSLEAGDPFKFEKMYEDIELSLSMLAAVQDFSFYAHLKAKSLDDDLKHWNEILPISIKVANKEDFVRYVLAGEDESRLWNEYTEEMGKVYKEMGIILPALEKYEDFLLHPYSPDTYFGRQNVKFYRVYDPINDTPHLYTEMAKVDLFDTKKLVKFSKEFGIPCGLPSRYSATPGSPSNQPALIEYGSVLEINKELTILRFLIELWNAIKYDDFNFMHSAICKVLSPDVNMNNKELKNAATNILINELEIKNKGNSTFQLINGELHPAVHFNDLFEVAYYQLYQAIYNDSEFKRCEFCGSLFEVMHKGRRFCPPLPDRKRSTCENTYNRRKQRQKQKQKGGK